MKLIKQSSIRIKIVIIGLMLMVFTASPSTVNAVYDHFQEDFSGEQFDTWTFEAFNFSEPFQAEDHTFSFDNDQLYSNGTYDGYTSNSAYIVDTTAFGQWSFDVYIPTTAEESLYFKRLFAILFSDLKMGPEGIDPNSTHWSSFGVSFSNQSAQFRAFNGSPGVLSDITKTIPMEFNQTQHYDLIRTTERFYVFIDQTNVLNVTLSQDIGSVINHFTINTGQGTNIIFDNVKITTDAIGALSELGVEIPPLSSEESDDSILFYTLGAGIIALIGSTSYWRISKKKI